MGVVSSAFKSTVTFGGVVSSSFKSSQATLIDGIKKTTAESVKLTRQQDNLNKKIKAGAAAGRDVSKLQKKYEELGKSISDANADAAKLNRTLKARKVWMTPLAGLSKHTGLTGLATGVVGGLGSRFRGIKERGVIPSAMSFAGQNAGLAGGLAAGLVGGMFAINASTAEQAGVAKGYGVSLNKFKAWDAVGKQIGMNGEAFGDLAEELSNKIGEFKILGEQSSVSDAFTGLGITSSALTGKTNEQQMAFILNQALKMKDEQAARSMIDMIMGGEGNKILAYMKMSGKTYEELMSAQEKYILTTKEGENGAVRGQMAMSSMWTALSSAAQEVIGTLAGDLAPSITKYADEFSNWFVTGGKETLIKGITGFATSISDFWESKLKPVLLALWRGLQVLAEFINKNFADYETEFARTSDEGIIRQLANEEWDRLNPNASWYSLEDMAEKKAHEDEQVARKERELNPLYINELQKAQERPLSIEERFRAATTFETPVVPKGGVVGVTPLQQFPISVTVQAASGDDGTALGKKVAEAAINIFKLNLDDSGIMTPATLGG